MDRLPRRRPRRGRNVSGASLLEIMIASVILALVAIGIVEFFAKGRVWFDQEERKRVATQLAQEAMERTVARSYAQVVDWSEARKVASVPYAIAVTVTKDAPESDLKTVQADVSWPAAPGVSRTVSASTIVYNN